MFDILSYRGEVRFPTDFKRLTGQEIGFSANFHDFIAESNAGGDLFYIKYVRIHIFVRTGAIICANDVAGVFIETKFICSLIYSQVGIYKVRAFFQNHQLFRLEIRTPGDRGFSFIGDHFAVLRLHYKLGQCAADTAILAVTADITEGSAIVANFLAVGTHSDTDITQAAFCADLLATASYTIAICTESVCAIFADFTAVLTNICAFGTYTAVYAELVTDAVLTSSAIFTDGDTVCAVLTAIRTNIYAIGATVAAPAECLRAIDTGTAIVTNCDTIGTILIAVLAHIHADLAVSTRPAVLQTFAFRADIAHHTKRIAVRAMGAILAVTIDAFYASLAFFTSNADTLLAKVTIGTDENITFRAIVAIVPTIGKLNTIAIAVKMIAAVIIAPIIFGNTIITDFTLNAEFNTLTAEAFSAILTVYDILFIAYKAVSICTGLCRHGHGRDHTDEHHQGKQ